MAPKRKRAGQNAAAEARSGLSARKIQPTTRGGRSLRSQPGALSGGLADEPHRSVDRKLEDKASTATGASLPSESATESATESAAESAAGAKPRRGRPPNKRPKDGSEAGREGGALVCGGPRDCRSGQSHGHGWAGCRHYDRAELGWCKLTALGWDLETHAATCNYCAKHCQVHN